MMKSFRLFFERRVRNPLRKKELERTPNSLDWVENEKENLPPEELEKIRRMEEFGVEPERIETFRQAKIKENEKRLRKEYLRTKIDKPQLILNKYGIKVFTDQYVTENFSTRSSNYNDINSAITKLVRDYKDIIPNRKPKIVITNTSENPNTKNVNILGKSSSPAGAYFDRLIYIDQYHVDDFDILIHEYAHFLSGRIPKQIEPLLKQEYLKLLDEYFSDIQKPKTKREKLEGRSNKKHRIQMAKKLGLPTDYASANFNEWFAELITHWKNMPNDKNTYRFKSILKKILHRV